MRLLSAIVAGRSAVVTLTGVAFTNVDPYTGSLIESDVSLEAYDGTETILNPDSISESTLVVTIPGTMPVGSYSVRAVKMDKESNPVVI